jgi:FkbM family methyltransferase
MMRYSQNNEQDHILNYFGDQIGTALDLGANDSVTFSNSRALILKGWNGVLVDASAEACNRARFHNQNRPDVEVHNVAIADRDGWVTLHESGPHATAGDTALLSSIIEAETVKWKPTTEFTTRTVPCLTIASLLARSKFKAFEFVTIDVEGMDLVALEALDLTALGTSMVIVEVNERDPLPYIDHCAKHGLTLLTRNAENLILVR